jgi:tRNA(fMet)-specific endonuclease VapC
VRYLFDTDRIIDALHGKPEALSLVTTLRLSGVAISVISLAEVSEGAYGAGDPRHKLANLRQFLAGFRVINVTPSVARRFAEERAQLRSIGSPIADLDLLIAATALRYRLTLVTRNFAHFERVPHLLLHRPGRT